MLENQTTLPFALLLDELDRRPETTRRARLEALLREAVQSGRLPAGAALPASRELAGEIGCSRWVVVQAYEQLVAEGFLESRGGARTRVRDTPRPQRRPAARPRPDGVPVRIDLTAGQPDLTAFPRAAWTRATRKVLASIDPADLNYIEPGGVPRCREAIVEHLRRVRGAVAHREDVHVCAGTSHALGLLCRAAYRTGHRAIAVEEPGWPPLRDFAEGAGLRPVPVPVDDQGLRVDALADHPEVRAVLVTPAHQFPAGVVLSPRRRSALLDWAQQRDGLIVEDDYDAEFRYDRRPVGCLQGLAPDRVAVVGSTSKTLAPGLRLGWLVTPPHWSPHIEATRRAIDLGISTLDQLVLAELLESGTLARHMRHMRKAYASRRTTMLHALRRTLPAASVVGIAAGLHMLVELPGHVDEEQLIDDVAAEGVKVYGLRRYQRSDPVHPGLVLGYARATDAAINEGIQVLARHMSP
ncbi:PLP-dependent aminotransferase family protein [Pseudonocardia acaciae]|uniref:MocR-like pyridoxine biosynthesis transcription factor PdxR n=1 Tax=Pseudonocardia acaciae TaxID=551276 RepID=UPI00048F64A4|nr:PLP-dependent aminotransferase family protein [Pseudonocardia acaciae]